MVSREEPRPLEVERLPDKLYIWRRDKEEIKD